MKTEFEKYVELNSEIKKKTKELKDLQKDKEKLQDVVLEQLAQLGVTSIKTDSGHTVHIHRRLWAKPRQGVDGEPDFKAASEALVNAGFPEFVHTRFNVISVSSLISELEKNEKIPPILRENLTIAEVISASVRKS